MLDARRFHVHFCLKVQQVDWQSLDSTSYDPLVLFHGPGSLYGYSQGLGPNFQAKDHREKSGCLFGLRIICVLEWRTEGGKCRLPQVKELENVRGEWHSI